MDLDRIARLRHGLEDVTTQERLWITGDPDRWDDAAAAAVDQGCSVLGFADPAFRHRGLRHRGEWIRRWFSNDESRVLFAGQPHKRWFNGAPRQLERCVWHQPLSPWRQSGRAYPTLMDAHGAAVVRVYDALADESSRATFASLVKGRVAGDSGYYRVSRYREYAHPVCRAVPTDTVLDVGAFIGRVAQRFMVDMRGRGRVIALEPMPRNFRKLRWKRALGVTALNVGAWHERATLMMTEERDSSTVARSGGVPCRVDTIDNVVSSQQLERVDLIKLDVEGAEMSALQGATETLRRFRPKLQLSIYHRKNDLFELPSWVMDQVSDYRFFLGHHTYYHTETDLYAVPNERC